MIARSDGASAGCGLLDERGDPMQPAVIERILARLGADDAVAAGVLVRDLHHGHDRGVGLVVDVDELADAWPVADDDVVRKDDRERLVTDEVLGHQDGMPEAQLLLLTDVGHLGEVADVADLPEHVDVALLLEQVLELVRQVEVVLDRPLLAGRDDDDLLDPGGDRLLDRVLDDRLVDEREHLLRLRLRGRQEAGAPSGGGEDGFANAQSNLRSTWAGPPEYTRGSREASRYGWSSEWPDEWPTPSSSPATNRRTASLNASGRSRFERCVAPRRRTIRAWLRGPREVALAQPERQVELPVEDQRRPGVRGQRRQEAVPGEAAERSRATRRPEPARDDRVGDGRREARPEEPAVEGVQTVPVEACP